MAASGHALVALRDALRAMAQGSEKVGFRESLGLGLVATAVWAWGWSGRQRVRHAWRHSAAQKESGTDTTSDSTTLAACGKTQRTKAQKKVA